MPVGLLQHCGDLLDGKALLARGRKNREPLRQNTLTAGGAIFEGAGNKEQYPASAHVKFLEQPGEFRESIDRPLRYHRKAWRRREQSANCLNSLK